MNYRFAFFIILQAGFNSLFGQQIKPKIYNYGNEKMWNNPTAAFTFKNTTSDNVLLLPIAYQRDVLVQLPEGYISPGEEREIKVQYFTEQTGNFKVTIPVYMNTSPLPVYLEMKGNIRSFHPDALTSCPIMDRRATQGKSGSSGSITVYDKTSGRVITGLDILLDNPAKSYLLEGSTKEKVPVGNVNSGMYNLVISKEGYESHEEIIYINRNSGDFTYYLERSKNFNTLAQDKERGNNEFIELLPEDQSQEMSIERVRKMMNEKFKGKKIIEKDVVVIKENPVDSASIVRETELKKSDLMKKVEELPDYNPDGSLNKDKYGFNNVVFLIDVSGSMYRDDKLPVLKESIKSMINVLRKEDLITIIIYSSRPAVLATSISASNKPELFKLLDTLQARGNSYGAEGLQMAYEQASAHYILGGNNQVILASDGLFNSKEYSRDDIYNMTAAKTGMGIKTSTMYFGMNRDALNFMKKLASEGKGSCIDMKSSSNATEVLVNEIKNNSLKQ